MTIDDVPQFGFLIELNNNLRYELGGKPLYMTNPGDVSTGVCQYCGQPQQFEVQLMPSLVTMLNVKGNTGM